MKMDCPKGHSHRSWITFAKCYFGNEPEWITGNGPIALITKCRNYTITLWDDETKADFQKQIIDKTGCSSFCGKKHYILDLREIKEEKK